MLALDPRRGRCWRCRAQCDAFAAERARRAANELRARGRSRDELKPFVQEERKLRERIEEALRRALEFEPDYPEALMLLGRALADRGERAIGRGDTKEGIEALTEAERTLGRLVEVIPATTPDWAEAATARAKIVARRDEIAQQQR